MTASDLLRWIIVFGAVLTVLNFYICIAPVVTEDNFEDLLAYDDVLLDYFNAFLSLPVSSFYKIHYIGLVCTRLCRQTIDLYHNSLLK